MKIQNVLDRTPSSVFELDKGNKPKDFSKKNLQKSKKIKKILKANPDIDEITDIKDYIFPY